MDKDTRDAIESATQRARKLLEEDFSAKLEGDFDVHRNGEVAAEAGKHLSTRQALARERIVAAIEHKRGAGMSAADAVRDYLRDAAFTTLNRFVALKMLEARDLVQECITKGEQSGGYREFCGMAPGLQLLPDSAGYRLYIESLFDELSTEVKVLFDRRDTSSVLWPRRTTFEQILEILNASELARVWGQDETIGWVYQYFNSQDERKTMREESPAPRNSRELAVRNQFFTPRYVVKFLTDNTLGRIWYEMRDTKTALADKCKYLVRKPGEALAPRAKKDPRDLRVLDPACGSGHFLLYTFDLLLAIYEEAYADPASPKCETTGKTLAEDYPSLDALRNAVPGLVLAHNLHGVDIDPRCAQIAQLALWMRAQKAYREFGIGRAERTQIRRSNIVVAEPLVADEQIAEEFVAQLGDAELGRVFMTLVDSLSLAGELGLLLRIEQLVAHRAKLGQTGNLFAPPEERIRAALDRFGSNEGSIKNTRRRLFADDAAHGVALLSVAEKKFDTVLMNPPFGSATSRSTDYIDAHYPDGRNDIYACFVSRAVELLSPGGAAGQITSSTCLTLDHLEQWRLRCFFGISELCLVSDLGSEVLDGATVKTAAFIVTAKTSADRASVSCLDLRSLADKRMALLAACQSGGWSEIPSTTFTMIPGAPVAYSLPPYAAALIASKHTIDSAALEVNVGMMSGDDFRYLRAWWELPIDHRDDWSSYEKGNGYKRFVCDPVLVVRSASDFAEAGADVAKKYGSASRFIMNRSKYGRAGLAYTRITNKGFSVRFLPPSQVFSGAGLAIFPPDDEADTFALLGILNSRYFECALRALTDGRKWEAGYVRKGPLPVIALRDEQMASAVRDAGAAMLAALSLDETTRFFSNPLRDDDKTTRHIEDLKRAYRDSLLKLDVRAGITFGVADEDHKAVDALVGDVESWVNRESVVDDTIDLAERCRLFLLGCAFRRWRSAPTKEVRLDDLLKYGLPVEPPQLAVAVDPVDVLVDDCGHSRDIGAALRLHAQELRVTISEDDAREWSRSLAFTSHLKQYTDNRRKAPIYWQLAIPSKGYSVWLYIHSFSKDTLFRVQNEYVGGNNGKLVHEERRLESLISELHDGGTAAQRKELAAQEEFVDELRMFLDEVKRIAPLWNPNLDDGVIINFAPLWRLVPQHKAWQKELKATWDALCEGQYDWAHLAMHLWPERVVPKCAKDRSLAIAHGLEAEFWAEGTDGKWAARKVPTRSIEDLVKERASAAVKSALKSLLEAPVASGAAKKTRKGKAHA